MDFDVRVVKKEADDEYDIRLERRLKRRCIANKMFSSDYVKKTRNMSVKIKDAPMDVDVPDEDHAEFLKYLSWNNCDGDNEADVFARCLYDGHNDIKMDRDNDQYVDPPDNLCLIDDDVPMDMDENDEDYAVFFNCLVQNIDDNNDGDVSARFLGDDNENVKNVEEDDQDGDPQHDMCMEDDHDDLDPQYKIFLENLREDGQSYVLEVVTNNGMSMVVKYEGEKGLFDGLVLDPQGTLNSWQREETETANGHISNMRESDTTDEDYQEFLSCLKNDGENIVYNLESGIPLIYEEDAECSDDLEIVGTDEDPFSDGYFTPFVASRLDSIIDLDAKTSNGSPGSYGDSQFRKRLMEILRSPYDAKEYEYLLHEVSRRRQTERNRELRNGTKSYTLESVAKSYLDQHHDFAREIISAEHDRRRVLNLLRGFFFWLQNLVQKGAFQPWKDSSCLNILPEM
ncbi:hypothetical protein F2P56_002042 [Juglans regia]|uniref:Uncharacterized protein LOC108993716 n=2 Tax=Juglans regia TaxID=51240 RepID=A0A2I4EY02_JUGRE|nr:uncharacterized protein LOC108993716 [Juglans regia]XP_018824264.1 uncharacterized protein LOC108993716 [Juglans regia]XP_018824265.1 uncharacterized protein LOC108993716 [Juglans regia]XP_018824267.1 uncharacterized protein LOC108993716 [Juglans regia]KAF5481386.1 hypothetical protein F2P56_002042 [Juglans regia]